jgi:3-methyladenine DNA glycosylase/8-oxoguanine DNA glycosylase
VVMGINLRTDDDLDAVIARLAARFGTSRQQAIARVLIEADAADTRAKRMSGARARVLGEWSETLEALADS